MKQLLLIIFAVFLLTGKLQSQVDVAGAHANSNGSYATLKDAFDAINAEHQGGNAITVSITASISDDQTATLNDGAWATILIYPTTTGLTISGTVVGAPLINLNGTTNITIDGRVNAEGDNPDLTIVNESTSNSSATSTIRFINGAMFNTIRYCYIRGAATSYTGANILMRTSSTFGNSNNTFEHNNLTGSLSGNRPVCIIRSEGSPGFSNSDNEVKNNNFYDFINPDENSGAIQLNAENHRWGIVNNSFYETTDFSPFQHRTYYAIAADNYPGGNDFTISNNYIGGSGPQCGGEYKWRKKATRNSTFYAITLRSAAGTASDIHGNVIKNFDWNNMSAADFEVMYLVGGTINVGTKQGNIIGDPIETNSILITNNGGNRNFYGFFIGEGTITLENNTIGSITVQSPGSLTSEYNFYGVRIGSSSGNKTVKNNLIGSRTTENSINIDHRSNSRNQLVFGIWCDNSGTNIIENNTIANIRNGTINSIDGNECRIQGIFTKAGNNTIKNNEIYNLTITNPSTATNENGSVAGINLHTTDAGKTQIISGNSIYNLSNSHLSFEGEIAGIRFNGGTGAAGTRQISENFIHNLSVNPASSDAKIYGIKIVAGQATYTNNVIALQDNNPSTMYGIFESGTVGNNNNLYFNTIHIGGSLESGTTNPSYALYSNASTNSRNFRNNVISNSRATSEGSNLHYGIFLNYGVNTDLVLDYNNYHVSGAGGVLGYYNSTVYLNLNDWKTATSRDENSTSLNPGFSNPTGNAAMSYATISNMPGQEIASVSADFGGKIRATPPTKGAWERATLWTGATNSHWGTNGNWIGGEVPGEGSNIIIPATANHPVLDISRNTGSITIESSTVLTIPPGTGLTVTGLLTNQNNTSGLVLGSNATGTGSLIHNTANVPASIQRYIVGGGYHNVSVPLAEGSVPPVEDLFLHAHLFRFHAESTPQSFTGFGDFPFPITSNQGYLIWYTGGTTTFNHAGNLNNGSFTALTNSGPSGLGLGQERYNLVPNPYPSAIDWLAPTGWTKENLHNAVYVWNREEADIDNPRGQYASFVDGVGNMGGSRYIPVGQAFFVEASSAGNPMLQMDNGVRVHNGQPFLKYENTISDVLRIHAATSFGHDETVVRFNQLATAGFDGMFDARKLAGTATLPQLYTMSNDGHMLSINALPAQNEGATIVPLAIDWEYEGEISLSVNNLESFEPTTGIHLEDLAMNIIMSLRENQSYTFTHQSSTIHPRFRLHFNSLLAIESHAAREGHIWSHGNTVFISIPETSENHISIAFFDTMGKTILMHEGKSSANPIMVNIPYRGVVVARVIAGDQLYTRKLLIQ